MGNLEHIDDLIARVLSGEAKADELAALESWVNASPDNKTYYESGKELFMKIESFKTQHKVDTVKAWDKLNTRISQEETKVIPLFNLKVVLRVAASILLLATLSLILNDVFNTSTPAPTVLASNRSIIEQKLPDGSGIVLNRNSEVSYVVNKYNVREVKLKGEAYFNVVHNEEQPFIISIGSIVIKDIGTSFNVKALEGSDTVEVYVESGEVQFYYEKNSNSGLNLTKGEKALYMRSTGKFYKYPSNPNENTVSYKSRIFHFKGAKLKEVVKEINSVYDSDIQLSTSMLGNCRLSVVFNQEDLEEIVTIIAETLDLQVERSANTILLKGQPCAE